MLEFYGFSTSYMSYLNLSTEGARAALTLGGTMLGYYPVRVLPSKTAILPVNPTFLPRVRIADIFFSSLAYFMCCTC